MQVDVIKLTLKIKDKYIMELNLSDLQIYVNVFINIIQIKFGGRIATYTLNN